MSWMMSPPQFPGRYFFYSSYLAGALALNQDCSTPFWLCGEGNGRKIHQSSIFERNFHGGFSHIFPCFPMFHMGFPYFLMFFPHISHGISQATFDDTGVGRHLLHHYDGCSPQVPVHHGPRYRPLAWRCDQTETTKTHQTGIQPAKIGLKQPFHADLLGI